MGVGEIDVLLRFDQALGEDARAEFLNRMRARTRPVFALNEGEDQSVLRFWRADEQGALAWAQALIRGLCDRIGIDAGLISVSLASCST